MSASSRSRRTLQRHGGKTILIGRFIGLVRALAPFIAGSSRMPYRAFVPYSILGTGLWAAAFCLLGYVLSNSLDKATEIAGTRGSSSSGSWSAWWSAAIVITRFLREPENRERLAERIEATPGFCAGCCPSCGSSGTGSRRAASGSSSRACSRRWRWRCSCSSATR